MESLDRVVFLERSEAALSWLKRSIEVHGGKGSAAFHAWWRYPHRGGWAPPYPETTGYILETLLDFYQHFGWEWLSAYARTSADWLCDVQLSNGAFPALYAHSGKPSVFNTGQILFGLHRFDAPRYQTAIEEAVRWLLKVQDPKGGWTEGLYRPAFVPTYYTRVLWALLLMEKRVPNLPVREVVFPQLAFFSKRLYPDRILAEAGFYPGAPAFTHTLAYAMRGFLETYALLEDTVGLEMIQAFAQWLAAKIQEDGRLAGAYSSKGQGDLSFRCLTGQAQLSIFYFRLWELFGQADDYQLAKELLVELFPYQALRGHTGKRGAIAGSAPLGGAYLPYKYPNWAVKFYLDALFCFGKSW